MSDYIVLVVTSVAISVCLSGAIIGITMGDQHTDLLFVLKSHLKSIWSALGTQGDEIDILRARVTDLENKVNEITKEMEKLDDGK